MDLQKSVSNSTGNHAAPGLDYWRQRLLSGVLLGTVLLGAVVYVPSIYMAFTTGLPGVVFIDTVAMAGVTILYVARRIPYRIRAASFVGILYVLGTWLLVEVGPISQIYLFGFAVFSSLLLGLRAAAASLVLNCATLFLVGYYTQALFPSRFLEEYGSLQAWSVITLNFMLVNSVVCLSLVMLLKGLERSLLNESASAAALLGERDNLADAYQRLEHEMTQRAQVEAELLRLAMAVDQASDAVILLNNRARVEYINAAYTKLTGFTRENAIGRSLVTLIRNFVKPADLLVEDGGLAPARRIRLRWKGEEAKEVAADISPLRDETGEPSGFAIIMRDLTAEAASDQRQRHSQKLEAIGTLAGGIAHDFNNILTAIMGYAQMLKEGEPTPELVQEGAEEILTASSRGAELIRQILAFSRRAESDRLPVLVSEIVAEAQKLLRPTIPSTIEIRTYVRAGAAVVLADPVQLHQVVVNLMTNAWQAMESRGGTITIEVDSVEADEMLVKHRENLVLGGQYVRLTVSDTGCGMDAATLERIYDPFFTTKERGRGTGLGLATVHGIVTGVGGEIITCSEPGAGTKVEVYLPEATPTVPAAQRAESQALPARGRGERILVVDDEESLLRMTEQALGRLGYTSDTFVSSTDALRAYESNPSRYDLVLTDLTMPTLDGEALAARIRKIRPETPIVMMSGFMENRRASSRYDQFLQKPFRANQLAVALDAALAAVRGADSGRSDSSEDSSARRALHESYPTSARQS